MSLVSSRLGAKASSILVVDDSPGSRFLIQTVLEEEGYEVLLAQEGSSALLQIEHSPPDLVVLDVFMPGINGYEVTQRIRRNRRLPFIPILLITAFGQPDVAQGLDLGADDFLRKPVEVKELLARIRALLRLKQTIDDRDLITRQREDFVARLTHDLRTPLIAAGRMLTLFQQGVLGDLPPAMLEAIATMERSNQNLLQMVNNLLEVQRYEASRKTLNFTSVDLQDLIQEVGQELTPLVHERGLALQFDLDDGGQIAQGSSVRGDRLELHRVLVNLLANAIKFTNGGTITIRLKVRLSPPSLDKAVPTAAWLAIEVEDTGIGIAPSEQAQIFERFRQGGRQELGSGLGLHLTRLIVEAHRGVIEVESEVGKGSLFRVYLPLESSEPKNIQTL